MTAGSRIYIDTQGIVQDTYETLAEAGRQHYGGDMRGRWILTADLGGMRGAQPLTAVMVGACCLAAECAESRINFRMLTRYLDTKAQTLEEALSLFADRTAWSEAYQWARWAMPPTSSPKSASACRRGALDEGLDDASAFPGFAPADIRPQFCRGIGRFRWVALSGDPEDIYKADAKMTQLFHDSAHLHRWLDMVRERIAVQGLSARISWIGLGDRNRAGLAFNDMVASGELKAYL